jgi:hypothetical protein
MSDENAKPSLIFVKLSHTNAKPSDKNAEPRLIFAEPSHEKAEMSDENAFPRLRNAFRDHSLARLKHRNTFQRGSRPIQMGENAKKPVLLPFPPRFPGEMRKKRHSPPSQSLPAAASVPRGKGGEPLP